MIATSIRKQHIMHTEIERFVTVQSSSRLKTLNMKQRVRFQSPKESKVSTSSFYKSNWLIQFCLSLIFVFSPIIFTYHFLLSFFTYHFHLSFSPYHAIIFSYHFHLSFLLSSDFIFMKWDDRTNIKCTITKWIFVSTIRINIDKIIWWESLHRMRREGIDRFFVLRIFRNRTIDWSPH